MLQLALLASRKIRLRNIDRCFYRSGRLSGISLGGAIGAWNECSCKLCFALQRLVFNDEKNVCEQGMLYLGYGAWVLVLKKVVIFPFEFLDFIHV